MENVKISSPFTDREWEIMAITSEGKAAKEIGDCLGISTKTVSNHLQNIKIKTGLTKTVELVIFYYEHFKIPQAVKEAAKKTIATVLFMALAPTLCEFSEDPFRIAKRVRFNKTVSSIRPKKQ